jgi:hypothetical protein
MPAFARCTLKPNAGRAVILSSNHFAGLANWESRNGSFNPFVDALLRRAALGNPRIDSYPACRPHYGSRGSEF